MSSMPDNCLPKINLLRCRPIHECTSTCTTLYNADQVRGNEIACHRENGWKRKKQVEGQYKGENVSAHLYTSI